jgi:hypothetical protein
MKHLVFFGFYRDGNKYKYNFDIKSNKYNKYIYTPTINNENNTNLNNEKMFLDKFGSNTKIVMYKYDKNIHINKYNKISKEKFINKWYQQAYRIFSFFYNIRGGLNMLKNDKHNSEDIILLSRIDIGINIINENKIKENLDKYDVIVCDLGSNHVRDMYFIFKYKHIDVFIKLYDSYELYISDIINNVKGHCISTRPEDIFHYHFSKNNLKMIDNRKDKMVNYIFKHVCSEFCGHNKTNTKT